MALSHFEDGKVELEITYSKGYKSGEEILFYENGYPKYKKNRKFLIMRVILSYIPISYLSKLNLLLYLNLFINIFSLLVTYSQL